MIISNQVLCNKCGDKPFSRFRHDYQSCECGAVAVDGGMDYLRRVGDLEAKDISIVIENIDSEEIVAMLKRQRESLNELGVLCLVMRELRDRGYLSDTASRNGYGQERISIRNIQPPDREVGSFISTLRRYIRRDNS